VDGVRWSNGPRIHGWCRHSGLQEADAQDVTQTVLLKMLGAMQGFRYDPAQKFRGWLRLNFVKHVWLACLLRRNEDRS
jgi:RNA polymerase sigma-70 factor (ECF subfamily)